MKIVIPGGTGQVGRLLTRAFRAEGHRVVLLSRNAAGEDQRAWDGASVGDWVEDLEGADAVINLAGRSVNCRYTAANLDDMMRSRVESARAIGLALRDAARPPQVWLQMSTATIYAHRFDAPNDEASGIIGGGELGAPKYWGYSIEIAKAWEAELERADTPRTRKVALRAAMVMSPDRGGIFDMLLKLVRLRLGGPVAGGRQFVSWIHERDFVRAVELLIERRDLSGVFNLASPHPLPQREFMSELRAAAGVGVGLPAARWMAELGAFFLRTDTELLFKSRRVVPGRLLEAGFGFEHEEWRTAVRALLES